MTKRIVTSVVAFACTVLLAGCGSFGVRVAENDGGPVKVGVSAQKGPASDPEPTEKPIPDGFRKEVFSGDCPFEVTMAMPDEYRSAGSIGGMAVFSEDYSEPDVKIVVMCKKSFDNSIAKSRDNYLDYLLNEPESDMLLQNRYEIDGAAAAVFQAKLVKGEIFATFSDVQMVSTIYVGYADGTPWEVKVQATSPWGDDEHAKKHQTVIDHVSVDGNKLKTLDWKDM